MDKSDLSVERRCDSSTVGKEMKDNIHFLNTSDYESSDSDEDFEEDKLSPFECLPDELWLMIGMQAGMIGMSKLSQVNRRGYQIFSSEMMKMASKIPYTIGVEYSFFGFEFQLHQSWVVLGYQQFPVPTCDKCWRYLQDDADFCGYDSDEINCRRADNPPVKENVSLVVFHGKGGHGRRALLEAIKTEGAVPVSIELNLSRKKVTGVRIERKRQNEKTRYDEAKMIMGDIYSSGPTALDNVSSLISSQDWVSDDTTSDIKGTHFLLNVSTPDTTMDSFNLESESEDLGDYDYSQYNRDDEESEEEMEDNGNFMGESNSYTFYSVRDRADSLPNMRSPHSYFSSSPPTKRCRKESTPVHPGTVPLGKNSLSTSLSLPQLPSRSIFL